MGDGMVSSREQSIENLRSACEKSVRHLSELKAIHLSMDPPTRKASESEVILRARKTCLHVQMIISCEVSPESLHVIAPDVRAAVEQLAPIVKTFLSDGISDSSFSSLANNLEREVTLFAHPTSIILSQSTHLGGLGEADPILCLVQLYCWLSQLVADYVVALGRVAEILDTPKHSEILNIMNESGEEFAKLLSLDLLKHLESQA